MRVLIFFLASTLLFKWRFYFLIYLGAPFLIDSITSRGHIPAINSTIIAARNTDFSSIISWIASTINKHLTYSFHSEFAQIWDIPLVKFACSPTTLSNLKTKLSWRQIDSFYIFLSHNCSPAKAIFDQKQFRFSTISCPLFFSKPKVKTTCAVIS